MAQRRKDPDQEEEYERLTLKLKEARTSAGMTQSEVAGLLNRPQSFISKLERRERRVDFIELQELASIYGKHINFFVDNGVERATITTADIAALETARA